MTNAITEPKPAAEFKLPSLLRQERTEVSPRDDPNSACEPQRISNSLEYRPFMMHAQMRYHLRIDRRLIRHLSRSAATLAQLFRKRSDFSRLASIGGIEEIQLPHKSSKASPRALQDGYQKTIRRNRMNHDTRSGLRLSRFASTGLLVL